MQLRRLNPSDSNAYQELRLAALRDVPSAFGSSYEEEKDFTASTLEGRLQLKPDRGIFGAFEAAKLVGLVGLGREDRRKFEHKALLWGMYVTPQARGKGIGRALLLEALALARSVPAIRQVNLSVNAGNAPAIQLYESVGFKKFGFEPGAMLIDGELHDEMQMCLRFAEG